MMADQDGPETGYYADTVRHLQATAKMLHQEAAKCREAADGQRALPPLETADAKRYRAKAREAAKRIADAAHHAQLAAGHLLRAQAYGTGAAVPVGLPASLIRERADEVASLLTLSVLGPRPWWSYLLPAVPEAGHLADLAPIASPLRAYREALELAEAAEAAEPGGRE